VIQAFFFSDPWLTKYGPLGFAGLAKTLEEFEALNLSVEPPENQKKLFGQVRLWRKILDFLSNQYLMSRWAVVIAVGLFILVYAYFAILFAVSYYGIARIYGLSYTWREALINSAFMPFYATDLPKNNWLRTLGGVHCLLIVTIGIGTVTSFFKHKIEAVRKSAEAFSKRIAIQSNGAKYSQLEAKFEADFMFSKEKSAPAKGTNKNSESPPKTDSNSSPVEDSTTHTEV
jgi:hypothetical protein